MAWGGWTLQKSPGPMGRSLRRWHRVGGCETTGISWKKEGSAWNNFCPWGHSGRGTGQLESLVQSLSLNDFKAQLDEALSNLDWPQSWSAVSKRLDLRPPEVPPNLSYPVIILCQTCWPWVVWPHATPAHCKQAAQDGHVSDWDSGHLCGALGDWCLCAL